jgi:hypothetical protein
MNIHYIRIIGSIKGNLTSFLPSNQIHHLVLLCASQRHLTYSIFLLFIINYRDPF